MEAAEFKKKIKEVQDHLRGITIQFVTKNRIRAYQSLREFGYAVLKQEEYGHSFSVGQVWTNDGIKFVESFEEFVILLKKGALTGVRISSFYEPKDMCEFMKSFGPLD